MLLSSSSAYGINRYDNKNENDSTAGDTTATDNSMKVGDTGCVIGFVMDRFCIDRGTLFDNPSVQTLLNPERHSVHCLIDVGSCVATPFEILTDPSPGSNRYNRAWTLSETAKAEIIALAASTGNPNNSPRCRECTNPDGEIDFGFRVIFNATVLDMGTSLYPPTVDARDIQAINIANPSSVESLTCMDVFGMEEIINTQSAQLEDPAARFRRMALAHGSLMLIAWGWLLPTGAIFAKLSKHRPGDLWFKVHRIVQVLGLLLALAGWIIALNEFTVFQSKGESNYHHGVMGITVMTLGLIQPINALIRPKAAKDGQAKSPARKIWEYIHKGTGWIALLLAVPTIVLGTFQLPQPNDQEAYQIAYGAGCGGILLLTSVLLVVDKSRFKVDEEPATGEDLEQLKSSNETNES